MRSERLKHIRIRISIVCQRLPSTYTHFLKSVVFRPFLIFSGWGPHACTMGSLSIFGWQGEGGGPRTTSIHTISGYNSHLCWTFCGMGLVNLIEEQPPTWDRIHSSSVSGFGNVCWGNLSVEPEHNTRRNITFKLRAIAAGCHQAARLIFILTIRRKEFRIHTYTPARSYNCPRRSLGDFHSSGAWLSVPQIHVQKSWKIAHFNWWAQPYSHSFWYLCKVNNIRLN